MEILQNFSPLRILRQAHRPVLPFLSFRIFRQKTWIMVFTAFPWKVQPESLHTFCCTAQPNLPLPVQMQAKGGIMKKSQHNSSTSLFLMEMILALLFLSLCSAACIQILRQPVKTVYRQNSGIRFRHSPLLWEKHWKAAMDLPNSFLLFFRMAHRPTTAWSGITTIPGRTVPEMRQITKWFSFCPQPPLKNPESFPSAISRKILCFIRSP